MKIRLLDEDTSSLFRSVEEKKLDEGIEFTKEAALNKLDKDPEFVKYALLKMYERQEDDEKNSSNTTHKNGVGFNSHDANFLSSLAQQLERKKSLSTSQIDWARKLLKKYTRQIIEVYQDVYYKEVLDKSVKKLSDLLDNSNGKVELTHKPTGDAIIVRKLPNNSYRIFYKEKQVGKFAKTIEDAAEQIVNYPESVISKDENTPVGIK